MEHSNAGKVAQYSGFCHTPSWGIVSRMSYTKVLRFAIITGLCAVFFVPFIIANGSAFPDIFNIAFPVNAYFPFITGKNFVFRILIEILFGLYILLALREPKYRPRASVILWTLFAFVVWMGVVTVFSVDPIKSFWSNFERMDGYITLLHLFVYFIMLGAVVGAEGWWDKFLRVCVFSGALMGILALLQLLHIMPISSQSGARVDTTFGNAIYLAVYMLFSIFITLFMLVRERRSTLAQAVYGIALVLEVVALYYSQTRGAQLGLIGGLIVTGIWIAWRGRGRQWHTVRQVAFWGLGFILVVMVAFIAARNTSFVKNSDSLERLASISLSDPTTSTRLQIWEMAYKGILQKPITGWGQENFDFVFNKYYQPSLYSQEAWFDRAHNQFIDWAVDGGLPALLLYLGLFGLMAWTVVKSDLEVPEQAILLGLLVGYGLNNLTNFDDIGSYIYFFTVLALIHGLCQKRPPGFMFLSKPAGDRTIAIVTPFIIVIVAVGAWAINAPGIVRAETLVNAITTQVAVADSSGNVSAQPKDPKQNLAEFQVALGENEWPGTPLGQQEVTEQLWQFATNLITQTSVDPSVQQSVDALAQSAGVKILAERPHDARLELFDGTFLASAGQGQPALQELQGALADSPGKQQIMFQIGVFYINENNPTAALPVLKQAFDEAPGYTDARVLYASALYYAGQNVQADALLIQGFGTVLEDNPTIIQVYTNTKQYARVAAIYQARITADPTTIDNYVDLAQFYFGISDVADTIATLKKAELESPSMAGQIQTIITEINNGTLKPGQ
jgi:O-antigen ligase/tetratricopeptide (TPR) repeat protein